MKSAHTPDIVSVIPSNPILTTLETLADDLALTPREMDILVQAGWSGQRDTAERLGISLGTVQQICHRHRDAWIRLRGLRDSLLLSQIESAERDGITILQDWLRECRSQTVADPADVRTALDALGRCHERIRARTSAPPAWQSLPSAPQPPGPLDSLQSPTP